jgi:hypothetical protein
LGADFTLGRRCRKREAQNGEDKAIKRQQIWTERRQIRSAPPPSATPKARKTKEEDDRLLES